MRHARTAILITICALVLPGLVSAQPSGSPDAGVEEALKAIRPEAIRAHMRFLADDLLEGRETASRGYDLAARYVETVFQGLGLEPAGAGGSYLQPVPLMRTATVESESTLALVRNGRRTELKYKEDFFSIAEGLAETDSSVTAPVVFVGYGVTAPELKHDDYAGVDVRGKIVLLLMGAPASFPADRRAFYSENLGKIRAAASRGAVGVLGMPTPEAEQRLPWEIVVRSTGTPGFVWVDERGRGRAIPPEIRGLALMSRKTAELFFEGAPRSLESVFETAEAGRPQAFDLPVQASLRTVGRGEQGAESPNVAAVLRGSDPRLREEYVVVTAHLDHLGVGTAVEGDAIYNGAYDNASGIAILLELARAFTRLPAPPRRSVLFLAVTAEERGLQGSDFFAHRPTVPIDRIVANINLDMFLMLYPLRDVIAYGSEHSSLNRVVEEAAGRLGIGVSPDPRPEEVVFIRSDHYSFVRQGIPAMMLTAGVQEGDSTGGGAFQKWLQERYHQPGDDMNQEFDFEAGAQFVRLNFLISWQVAQEEKAPSWNPGDFFGEKFSRQAGAPKP